MLPLLNPLLIPSKWRIECSKAFLVDKYMGRLCYPIPDHIVDHNPWDIQVSFKVLIPDIRWYHPANVDFSGSVWLRAPMVWSNGLIRTLGWNSFDIWVITIGQDEFILIFNCISIVLYYVIILLNMILIIYHGMLDAGGRLVASGWLNHQDALKCWSAIRNSGLHPDLLWYRPLTPTVAFWGRLQGENLTPSYQVVSPPMDQMYFPFMPRFEGILNIDMFD